MLVPIRRAALKGYKIIAFDTEDNSKGTPLWADFYDGEKHYTFNLRLPEQAENARRFFYGYSRTLFVAHNLEYDIINLFRTNNYAHLESMIYSARLIRAKLKRSTNLLYDTFNWYSVGLDRVALSVGKKKMDFTGAIEAMEEGDFKYLYNDTEIVWEFTRRFQNLNLQHKTPMRATIARMAIDTFCTRLPRTVTTFCNPTALKAYYGGRNEVFILKNIKGDIRAIDRNSSYPAEMAFRDYPESSTMRPSKIDNAKFGYGLFTIKVPEDVKYPALPFRHETKGLIFPTGEFTGWFIYDEVRKAIEQGATIVKELDGFGTNHACRPFADFILDMYSKREEANSAFEKLYYKQFMNSLSGKFCQHLPVSIFQKNIPSIKELKNKDISRKQMGFYEIKDMEDKPSPHSNYIWGIYITAYARLRLLEAIEAVEKAGHDVIYCDTDSVFYLKKTNRKTGIEYGTYLGKWKEEKYVNAKINTIKMYELDTGLQNEFGEPIKKIVCKGIPSYAASDFLFKGKAIIEKPVKFRESFSNTLLANAWHEVERINNAIYHKREVDKKGFSKPFAIYNMEAIYGDTQKKPRRKKIGENSSGDGIGMGGGDKISAFQEPRAKVLGGI